MIQHRGDMWALLIEALAQEVILFVNSIQAAGYQCQQHVLCDVNAEHFGLERC